jgi:hypothetical protein
MAFILSITGSVFKYSFGSAAQMSHLFKQKQANPFGVAWPLGWHGLLLFKNISFISPISLANHGFRIMNLVLCYQTKQSQDSSFF